MGDPDSAPPPGGSPCPLASSPSPLRRTAIALAAVAIVAVVALRWDHPPQRRAPVAAGRLDPAAPLDLHPAAPDAAADARADRRAHARAHGGADPGADPRADGGHARPDGRADRPPWRRRHRRPPSRPRRRRPRRSRPPPRRHRRADRGTDADACADGQPDGRSDGDAGADGEPRRPRRPAPRRPDAHPDANAQRDPGRHADGVTAARGRLRRRVEQPACCSCCSSWRSACWSRPPTRCGDAASRPPRRRHRPGPEIRRPDPAATPVCTGHAAGPDGNAGRSADARSSRRRPSPAPHPRRPPHRDRWQTPGAAPSRPTSDPAPSTRPALGGNPVRSRTPPAPEHAVASPRRAIRRSRADILSPFRGPRANAVPREEPDHGHPVARRPPGDAARHVMAHVGSPPGDPLIREVRPDGPDVPRGDGSRLRARRAGALPRRPDGGNRGADRRPRPGRPLDAQPPRARRRGHRHRQDQDAPGDRRAAVARPASPPSSPTSRAT